jgi:hypothetical protein
MDLEPIDLDLLQRHPEVSVIFLTEKNEFHSFFFRLDHPYFDEIEAFEPDETLLKPVEPHVSINMIQYTNRTAFVVVSKTNRRN